MAPACDTALSGVRSPQTQETVRSQNFLFRDAKFGLWLHTFLKFKKGNRRSWNVMECHEKLWKVMEGGFLTLDSHFR